jgi:Tol biopolymer transport system component/predicted Ser/Thr protein kinase
MNEERWRQIEELYHAAREDRAVLDKADPELRGKVEALLAQDSGGKILDRPAWEAGARLTPGSQIGPYRIEARLGAGGMGEVYRAHDTRLRRDVAVKVSAAQFTERFEREARAIAALNHPNICTLYDVGPNYLVMELVEGKPLKGPLPLDQALQYAAQICDALDAAHRKAITHRDLKPGNILVTKQGIKLLDFGLARMAPGENDPTLTHLGDVMGTPAYMAPEQREGKPGDARSDIYAFGCVLYELLTGKRVAEERTPVGPAALESVLGTCLEKDPEDRWQSARELKHALGWVGPAILSPAITSPATRSPAPLGWIAAGVLALALIVTGTLFWRATRPPDRPLMRFNVDLGPEAVEGVNITAAISPDGTRLAFVARDPGGKEQLATRLLDQAKATLLPGTENAVDPFFSPDGQWIGFFADGKMKKISVQGGAAVALCDAAFTRGASWGEDGSIIVANFSSPGIGLSRVPAAGGTPQAITKPGEKGEALHRWPQILPGGQAVLFTGDTVPSDDANNANIEVLSLKTGQWKVVQSGGYFGRYLPSGHLVYVHQGTLFAVGFDLDRLEVRGTPAPVLEDVARNATTGGAQYDVARNGTLVYRSGKSSNESWTVAWMDSTGKTQPLPALPGQYHNPRFSPDGKRLALAVGPYARGDIQVYDWQRDTMTRVTFTRAGVMPVWTPDGKHIVFRSQAAGRFSLWWIRADGAGESQLLLESKGIVKPSSFSPDGKRLAFEEQAVDTGWDLWTLPLDVSDPEHPKPGKPELFLGTPFNENEPAFSPDGRWIAYTSNELGRIEVYVRPGGTASGSGKWQISTDGGSHPIWSRGALGAGRELFYQAPDTRIMVASYTAKADSFAPEKPRLWSNTQILEPSGGGPWDLDLAPDGKRFAVFPRPNASGEQKGSVHVTFLLNFFDELRRRAPAGKPEGP